MNKVKLKTILWCIYTFTYVHSKEYKVYIYDDDDSDIDDNTLIHIHIHSSCLFSLFIGFVANFFLFILNYSLFSRLFVLCLMVLYYINVPEQ